eukprot:scaffold211376_cov33-Tisochrysis_lutea.AAC.1
MSSRPSRCLSASAERREKTSGSEALRLPRSSVWLARGARPTASERPSSSAGSMRRDGDG